MKVENINIGDKFVIEVTDKMLLGETAGKLKGQFMFTTNCKAFTLFEHEIERLMPMPETTQEAYNAGFIKGYEAAIVELDRAMKNAVMDAQQAKNEHKFTYAARIPTASEAAANGSIRGGKYPKEG